MKWFRFVCLAAALMLALGAHVAVAFIPQAERIAKAIAAGNAKSRRAQALRIEIEMRIGESPPVAWGEIVTHPAGMARLELRASGGLVEKHILQGNQHLAARNGERLSEPEPRAFLPPLFLLQMDSAESLNAALEAFRIQAGWVGISPCGESDCYVLGDPDRVPPARPLEVAEAVERAEEGDGPERETLDTREALEDSDRARAVEKPTALFPLAPGERHATLWVDMESFEVRRMRLAGGVRVQFGPYVVFERVRVPSWLQIEEERGTVRFDLIAVTPVNAPASAFDPDWLVAPTTALPGGSRAPAGSPNGPDSAVE